MKFPASIVNTDMGEKISPPSATNTQRRAERILPISARFKFTPIDQ
nr:MAG TPA: hypothetical protein [Caudoviricetes sp.]